LGFNLKPEDMPGVFKGLPVSVLGYQGLMAHGGYERVHMGHGQEQFRLAVEEVKSRLADEAEAAAKVSAAAADISGLTENFRILARDVGLNPSEKHLPLFDQVQAGLFKGLGSGKGEFVIRLFPEGLGELTVKLSESDGVSTLRIIAANSEAARLINGDLDALRLALAPMRVEVQDAVTRVVESQESQAGASNLDQFGQFAQFSQYSQFGQFGQSGEGQASLSQQGPGVSDKTSPDGEQADMAAQGQGAPSSELDRYV